MNALEKTTITSITFLDTERDHAQRETVLPYQFSSSDPVCVTITLVFLRAKNLSLADITVS